MQPPDFRPVALVPAYQAGSTVGDVVSGLLRHLPRVLVVDDGSTDGTASAAEAAGAQGLRLPEHRGKGGGIRAGLLPAVSSDAPPAPCVAPAPQPAPRAPPGLRDAARAGHPFVIGSRMGQPDGIPA